MLMWTQPQWLVLSKRSINLEEIPFMKSLLLFSEQAGFQIVLWMFWNHEVGLLVGFTSNHGLLSSNPLF